MVVEMDNLIDSVHTRVHPLYILRRVNRVMHSNRQVRRDHLFMIAIISTLIFSSMTMVNGFTNIVNGQTNATQTNSSNTTTNLVNTQDIPLEKVRVGDIEIGVQDVWQRRSFDTS